MKTNIQGEHKVFSCYKHLLQENYVEYKQTPQLAQFQPWITFQQDGARPHMAKTTMETLRKLKWNLPTHPPYSPDLAPK